MIKKSHQVRIIKKSIDILNVFEYRGVRSDVTEKLQ